ncbi:MAG: hypothetical protein IT541_12740 [Hyphomicrobiales bacterium]|jgi:hypothetical protein|nr:hypothetical protein [Hyphomicrobiales bacterium]
MERYDETRMNAALDKLLKHATDPAVPEGAEARLMLAIQSAGQQSNVVPFQPRAKLQGWAIGLPLAAALALGIYLGSQGTLDAYFPGTITDDISAELSDPIPFTGLDDAESYAEGDVT